MYKVTLHWSLISKNLTKKIYLIINATIGKGGYNFWSSCSFQPQKLFYVIYKNLHCKYTKKPF